MTKPMAETGGGIRELRQALFQRQHKFHLGLWARDMDVALTALETFAINSAATLAPDKLKLLSKLLFGDNVEYDAVTDILSRRPAPVVLAPTAAPAPFDLQQAIADGHHHPIKPGHAPRMPGPPPPPPPKRPGWA